jgi:hypothetical protein
MNISSGIWPGKKKRGRCNYQEIKSSIIHMRVSRRCCKLAAQLAEPVAAGMGADRTGLGGYIQTRKHRQVPHAFVFGAWIGEHVIVSGKPNKLKAFYGC